jgi:hypothetical protein
LNNKIAELDFNNVEETPMFEWLAEAQYIGEMNEKNK